MLLPHVKTTVIRLFLSAVLQVVSALIIAHTLGAQGNGQYAMAILLPMMLSQFLNLGIPSANIYFINKQKPKSPEILLGNIIVWCMLSAIGIAIAIGITYHFSDLLFPGITPLYLKVSMWVYPILLLQSFIVSIFQAFEKFKHFNTTTLIHPTLLLLSILTLSYLNTLNPLTTLIAYISGNSIALVVSSILFYKTNLHFGDFKSAMTYIPKLLKFGIKTHASNIIAYVNTRTDLFLVNYFAGPIASGVYIIAIQMAEQLWILSHGMSNVLAPRLSSSEETKQAILIGNFFRLCLLGTAFGGVILALTALPTLRYVIGRNYETAFIPILLLLPGIILGAGSRILGTSISALGKPEINSLTSIIAMGINITLNCMLIPKSGLTGAAIATSISYSFNSLAKVIIIRKVEPDLNIATLIPNPNDIKFLLSQIQPYLKKGLK